jgi:branched-chain amino acid transport system substrate-binding protein
LRHFYPTGVRNFFRVTPIDTHEVAADALLERRLGVRHVLVVADDQTGTSVIHTGDFVRVAQKLRLPTSVFTWHAERKPVSTVVTAVRRDHADGIFVPALYAPRTAQLVRAIRAAFGRRIPIVGTEFFDDAGGIWATAGGAAAAGVYVSWFGVPNAELPPAGRRFVHAFDASTPSFGAAYAAQATEVLLAAIARSDGTRDSVRRQLFTTDVRDGVLGRIRFDRNGDLRTGPITILRLRRGPSPDGDPDLANTVVDRVIVPPPSIVP